MIRACLFLLAGVYAPQLSSFGDQSDLPMIAIIALVAILPSRILPGLPWFCLGVALFAVATWQVVDSRIAAQYVGDSMLVDVRIVEFPRRRGQTISFVADPIGNTRVPARIRLSWFEPPVNLRLGDVWQFELRLKRPRGNSNPGVFDYETWMFRERFAATGYVVDGERNYLRRTGVMNGRDRVRQAFVDRLTALLPDSDAAAVIAAISVGARHLLSQEQWQRYARTGTSHLMAISGLHIGLAAGVAYFIALLVSGATGRRCNHHDVALIVSLIVAAAYAFVSGLDIPARRATLMIALVVVTVLKRRQLSPLLVVCAAAVAIVVLDPLATMAPGFKLSFGAVLVLIWVARRYTGITLRKPFWQTPVLAVHSLAKLQILLLLGLLPLTVLIFDRIALVAPLINLVAVPMFSLVTVPLALASLILAGPLQPIGDQALLLAADSVRLLEWGIARAASVPIADLTVASAHGFAWLFVATPLLLVALPPGWPGRHLAWVGVVALVLFEPAGPDPGCADIEILDVGHGLAAVVRTNSHVVVFDTGAAFRGGGSMGERVVLPYLSSRGIDRVDRLVVSHADLDHSGGAAEIVASIAVGQVLAGEPMPAPGIMSRPCVAGQSWHRDGIDFHIIHPLAGPGIEGNDASCVLIVAAGSYRLLLTGDIEKPVEHQLIRDGVVPAVDIVVVPHHGSRTSSSPPFVRALSPSLAIVSAGHGNRWGFPKKDIVARWEAVGAEVIETATSGAIGLQLCERTGIVSISRHRLRQHRIWHEL